MASQLHNLCKAFRWGWWCLALGVLLCDLSGCKTWQTHDEGLRNDNLAIPARQARSIRDKDAEKDPDKKSSYDPWHSEEANRIMQDLD